MWAYNGQQYDPNNTLNFLRLWQERFDDGFAHLVNTNGEFQHDPDGGWAAWEALPVVDGTNKQAIVGDLQSFGLNPDATDSYAMLATVDRSFKLRFKNTETQEETESHTWAYSWTNDPLRWVNTDPTPPPGGVQACAGKDKGDGKGDFYGISGIEQLQGLN